MLFMKIKKSKKIAVCRLRKDNKANLFEKIEIIF